MESEEIMKQTTQEWGAGGCFILTILVGVLVSAHFSGLYWPGILALLGLITVGLAVASGAVLLLIKFWAWVWRV